MIEQSKLYSDEKWRGKWVISGFKFLNYEGKRDLMNQMSSY